ncbi:MAG TPA: helix-turn-helix domain-containing protein [Mycobacteriales bacterium]|nr:helix-turn-helix domain-containing protein [Mycobacteriales bacterium]
MTPATAPRECSVAAALEVIGEKWSLLVVRELILGTDKFNDIAANTGAPRDILTARLRRLEELGVIEREEYSSRPPRYSYVLTKKGRDLRPVVMALKHWGDTHVMGRTMPPVYEHSCGEIFTPATHCAACGEKAGGATLTRINP